MGCDHLLINPNPAACTMVPAQILKHSGSHSLSKSSCGPLEAFSFLFKLQSPHPGPFSIQTYSEESINIIINTHKNSEPKIYPPPTHTHTYSVSVDINLLSQRHCITLLDCQAIGWMERLECSITWYTPLKINSALIFVMHLFTYSLIY